MSAHHRLLDKRRWAALRAAVLDAAEWRCCTCGKRGRLEVDHIVPVSEGGERYSRSNLQALCRECHILKSGYKVITGAAEWRRRLAKYAVR